VLESIIESTKASIIHKLPFYRPLAKRKVADRLEIILRREEEMIAESIGLNFNRAVDCCRKISTLNSLLDIMEKMSGFSTRNIAVDFRNLVEGDGRKKAKEYVRIVQRYSHNPQLALRLSYMLSRSTGIHLSTLSTHLISKKFMDLAEHYGKDAATVCPYVASALEEGCDFDVYELVKKYPASTASPFARSLVVISIEEKDIRTKYFELIDRMEDERVIAQFCMGLVELSINSEMMFAPKKYVDLCAYLTGHEPHVYTELSDYLLKNPGNAVKADTLLQDHLKEEESQVLIPLLAIMAETENYELAKLPVKQDLVKAYSIARENVDDEGDNYLPDFYLNLKQCLDERPEKLGKWAESICSDFRKQGEKGLLRGVVG